MSEVTSGIADLIAKIKNDGVDAGNQERDRIVGSARAEAEAIINEAKAEAKRLNAAAEAESEASKKRLEAELQMAARDFVFRFRERLSAQAILPAAAKATEASLADGAAVAQLLAQAVTAVGQGSDGLVAAIDPTLRATVEGALATQIAEAGLELVDEQGLSGFRLQKRGEHYVWDCSSEAVAREFGRLVEPGLRGALSFEHSSEG